MLTLDLVGCVADDTAPALDTRRALRLTAGASTRVRLRLVQPNGAPYIPAADDVFTFTVKRSSLQPMAAPGFAKTATGPQGGGATEPGSVLFTVDPADTRVLAPGRYVYDCWLRTAAGVRTPVVPLSPAMIEPAATPAP